jgi:hypothetical protein
MDTITEEEIRQKLGAHYGDTSRDLVKDERNDSYGARGSVIYSLSGSPPKGYAIVIPELGLVNLYDYEGKRFRQLQNTVVAELQSDS